MNVRSSLIILVLTCALQTATRAQLTLVNQFSAGFSAVSCAYSAQTDTIWAYQSFGGVLHEFSATGTALGTIPRPGGAANDADLEVAPVAFTLGSTPVPQGSLLFIDGESGVAEIYAIDPSSGSVIASLATGFGTSHVVGGGYHVQRGTFFLVQDRVPGSGSQRNLVAEVDPSTGNVLSSFHTTTATPSFTVNFGDLDVSANGNLLIVSSDESQIGEYTPAGDWVDGHPLPAGTSSLCGIAVDETSCTVFTISTGGLVSELAANCPQIATIGSGCPSSGGNNAIVVTQLPFAGSTFRVEASGLPTSSNSIALAISGFSQLPQPLTLGALLPQGGAGCFAYTSSEIATLLLVNGGTAVSQLDLPPGSAGLVFYHQIGVVELDASLRVISATSTDALQLTVGSY